MRVGLNLIGFRPGAMGGVETYVRKLVQHLPALDPGVSLTLLCDDQNGDYFRHLGPGWEIVEFANRRGSFGRLLRSSVRRCFGIDLLRVQLDRLGLDLIHHPVSIMSPPGLKTPGVVTFLDMQHEFFPRFFTEKERRLRTERYKGSASAARAVIAISEHAKRCLGDRYGVEPGKVQVIHLGCDTEYRPIDDLEQLETVRSRLRLAKQFIYYPAATWPHKNHQALLTAMQILVERYNFDGHLVLTGIEKSPHEALLRNIESRRLGSMVSILGYLPYSDLPCLYNLAKMMVFPSLYEGFGLPLLEAMACGCPVVCSRTTSLPEVAGEAALYFDPEDPETIAEKVWAVWNDAAVQLQLRLAGIARARQFDWQETARKTLAVYADLLKTNSNG